MNSLFSQILEWRKNSDIALYHRALLTLTLTSIVTLLVTTFTIGLAMGPILLWQVLVNKYPYQLQKEKRRRISNSLFCNQYTLLYIYTNKFLLNLFLMFNDA
jgi:hypothetical protein